MNQSNINSHRAIRESIQKIAGYGTSKTPYSTSDGAQQLFGYVTAVHEEKGAIVSVDIREFVEFDGNDSDKGLHIGVLLTAIQDNVTGMVIVPKIHSTVGFMCDTKSQMEYVNLVSHVDVIKAVSHETVQVGVIELEEYKSDDPDSPDIDELQPTKLEAITHYTKDLISNAVTDGENASQINLGAERAEISIQEGKSVISATKDTVEIKRDSSKGTFTSDAITLEKGKKVVVKQDAVYLGDTGNTDVGVLGTELANILSEMLGYISKIVTTTQLGPQPPANIASFISLKAKIDGFKAAQSGFLTNKVKLQK